MPGFIPLTPTGVKLADPNTVEITTDIYGIAFFKSVLQDNTLSNLLFFPFNTNGNPNVSLGIVNQIIVKGAGQPWDSE